MIYFSFILLIFLFSSRSPTGTQLWVLDIRVSIPIFLNFFSLSTLYVFLLLCSCLWLNFGVVSLSLSLSLPHSQEVVGKLWDLTDKALWDSWVKETPLEDPQMSVSGVFSFFPLGQIFVFSS